MKVDLSRTSGEVFYKYIYPLFAEQFLFGSNYVHFAEMVQEKFILNATQWEYILSEWEKKEKRNAKAKYDICIQIIKEYQLKK